MQIRELKTILFINVELLIMVAFLLVLPFVEGKQTGSLNLSWSTASIGADQNSFATLQVIGREERGETFVRQVRFADESLTIEGLRVGVWELSVEALDEQQQILARSLPLTTSVRTYSKRAVHAVLTDIVHTMPVAEPIAAEVLKADTTVAQTIHTPGVPTSLKVAHQAHDVQNQTILLGQAVQQNLFTLDDAVFDQPVTLSFDAENPQLVSLNGMPPVLLDAPLTIERDTIVQVFSEHQSDPITQTFRIRVATPTVFSTDGLQNSKQICMQSDTQGAVLRYTIKDETYPYTGPFLIHENTALEVVAVKQGMQPSYRVFYWLEVEETPLALPLSKEVHAPHVEAEEPQRAISTSTAQSWQVGSLGPAGGIIFYDKGFYSENWRYLEAAPMDEIETYRWGQYGYLQNTGDVKEGCGLTNSKKVAQSEIPMDCAMYVCQAKTLSAGQHTYDDWFLPSRDELTALLHFKDAAGMNGGCYWSSSEASSVLAWQVDTSTLKASQYYKNAKYAVRAVRSF